MPTSSHRRLVHGDSDTQLLLPGKMTIALHFCIKMRVAATATRWLGMQYASSFLTINARILKYDLSAQEISLVDLPPGCHQGPQILLTTATQYGGLEVARVDKQARIHIWSMETGPNGLVRWVPDDRVIDLGTMRLANPHPFYVADIVHSLGAIIIWARDGVFSVDIKSKRVTKLCQERRIVNFVPYVSFCTPGTDTIQLCLLLPHF